MAIVNLRVILAGDLGKAVIDTWRPLARHGDECSQCGLVVRELKLVPDDPYPPFDRCCPAGQALFAVWTDAKIAFQDRLTRVTAPWGMAGLTGEEADDRAAALTAMPAAGALDIFEDADDDRREAKIRAVIAAYRSRTLRSASTQAQDTEERLCAGCGVRFVPELPRQRYHDANCRKRASDRRTARKPTLFGQED